MVCHNCNSDRIVKVNSKSGDRNTISYHDQYLDGYVPRDIGIGGGDYIRFSYCLNCGQMQGTFPIKEPDLLNED